MKFYVAASFVQKNDANILAIRFINLGHECVASWLSMPSIGYVEGIENVPWSIAAIDLHDVRRCEVFIGLIGDRKSPGGRHTELGVALALGKSIFLIGEREQVFHNLPQIVVVGTENELVKRYFS